MAGIGALAGDRSALPMMQRVPTCHLDQRARLRWNFAPAHFFIQRTIGVAIV